MNAIDFLNTYYTIPMGDDFLSKQIAQDASFLSKKDRRRIVGVLTWQEWSDWRSQYYGTGKNAGPIGKVPPEVAQRLAINILNSTLPMLKKEKIKVEGQSKFAETGAIVSVPRTHNRSKSSDSFEYLMVTRKGYYSYIWNPSPTKHLGGERFLMPSRYYKTKEIEQLPGKSLINWEQSKESQLYQVYVQKRITPDEPMLIIACDKGAPNLAHLALTYDVRHCVLNHATPKVLDLTVLFHQGEQS